MDTRAAKDFLVQQTVEQAALENIPLCDLERRMMYFTETEEMSEDPIQLNTAFEARYATPEYEAKISKLLRHAHTRLKQENPSSVRTWDEAVQELEKGDHYLIILLGTFSTPFFSSPKLLGWSFWKLLGVSFVLLVLGLALLAAVLHRQDNSGPPPKANSSYFSPTSFSNSPSLKTFTPNSLAFSYFDPGSAPTTT